MRARLWGPSSHQRRGMPIARRATASCQAALPSGGSDANHPQAVSDSVADLWTLLRDLQARGQLPAEVWTLLRELVSHTLG